MSMYSELNYWNNRKGSPNSKKTSFKNKIENHSAFIKKNLYHRCTIFEFGVGDGRLLFTYDNIASLVFSYDISTNWRESCIEESKKYSFEYIHFADSEIKKDLSSRISKFDVVVASLVLMHQKPSRIESVMRELYNIGKYVIVISKFDPKNPISTKDDNKSSYNFDYLKICRANRWNFTEPFFKENQIYFVYGQEI